MMKIPLFMSFTGAAINKGHSDNSRASTRWLIMTFCSQKVRIGRHGAQQIDRHRHLKGENFCPSQGQKAVNGQSNAPLNGKNNRKKKKEIRKKKANSQR